MARWSGSRGDSQRSSARALMMAQDAWVWGPLGFQGRGLASTWGCYGLSCWGLGLKSLHAGNDAASRCSHNTDAVHQIEGSWGPFGSRCCSRMLGAACSSGQ